MGGRLLFFPILRTRSARKKLVGRSVIVLLGACGVPGCEEAAPRGPDVPGFSAAAGSSESGAGEQPESSRDDWSRRAARELEALELRAGIERDVDPAGPGSDIKRDVDEFTTLDACVRQHRVADPVLADAVDALGYDTLVRDACRTLQALKAKDGKLCQPIIASSLRLRCESQVAVAVGDPSLCPLVGGNGAVSAREPVCLARASRDERLCAAAHPVERSTCRALVQGRPSECGSDATCLRQIERYRGLFEKPVDHSPFPARLHIEWSIDREKEEPLAGALDLDDIAAAGVIARPAADRVRLVIGSPKTAGWSSWDSPTAAPHLFLTLTVPTKGPGSASRRRDAPPGITLNAGDLTLDLLLPRIALLSGTLTSDRRVVVDEASPAMGSPLRLMLTTKVADAARVFRLKIELVSFVRDGVAPPPNGKNKQH
jgi:hypothetical protein